MENAMEVDENTDNNKIVEGPTIEYLNFETPADTSSADYDHVAVVGNSHWLKTSFNWNNTKCITFHDIASYFLPSEVTNLQCLATALPARTLWIFMGDLDVVAKRIKGSEKGSLGAYLNCSICKSSSGVEVEEFQCKSINGTETDDTDAVVKHWVTKFQGGLRLFLATLPGEADVLLAPATPYVIHRTTSMSEKWHKTQHEIVKKFPHMMFSGEHVQKLSKLSNIFMVTWQEIAEKTNASNKLLNLLRRCWVIPDSSIRAQVKSMKYASQSYSSRRSWFVNLWNIINASLGRNAVVLEEASAEWAQVRERKLPQLRTEGQDFRSENPRHLALLLEEKATWAYKDSEMYHQARVKKGTANRRMAGTVAGARRVVAPSKERNKTEENEVEKQARLAAAVAEGYNVEITATGENHQLLCKFVAEVTRNMEGEVKTNRRRGWLVRVPESSTAVLVALLDGFRLLDCVMRATLLAKLSSNEVDEVAAQLKFSLMYEAAEAYNTAWKAIVMESLSHLITPNSYKTKKCPDDPCNISTCVKFHGEKDKKRDPLIIKYKPEWCKLVKLGKCGDDCTSSHNIFEKFCHPSAFLAGVCTKLTDNGLCSKRPPCFDAHTGSPEMFYKEDWQDLYVCGLDKSILFLRGAMQNLDDRWKESDLQRERGGCSVILLSTSEDMARFSHKAAEVLASNYALTVAPLNHCSTQDVSVMSLTVARSELTSPLPHLRAIILDDAAAYLKDDTKNLLALVLLNLDMENRNINKVVVCSEEIKCEVQQMEELLHTKFKCVKDVNNYPNGIVDLTGTAITTETENKPTPPTVVPCKSAKSRGTGAGGNRNSQGLAKKHTARSGGLAGRQHPYPQQQQRPGDATRQQRHHQRGHSHNSQSWEQQEQPYPQLWEQPWQRNHRNRPHDTWQQDSQSWSQNLQQESRRWPDNFQSSWPDQPQQRPDWPGNGLRHHEPDWQESASLYRQPWGKSAPPNW